MKERLLTIAFSILFTLAALGLIFIIAAPPRGTPIILSPQPSPAPIMIHIKGAVQNPGLYELPYESRLIDAVDAAGGFTELADTDTVNLARQIFDGEMIIIPTQTQESQGTSDSFPQVNETAPQPEGSGKININIATQAELETLPGIGPTKAADIITYREENGPFDNIEEIMNVSGIGPGTFDKIKEMITTK